GICGIGKGLVIHGAGLCAADPPANLLHGQFCTVCQGDSGHDIDHIPAVRVGEVGSHQLTVLSIVIVHPLDEGYHGRLYGGVAAVIDQNVEFVGLNGSEEGGIGRRLHRSIIASSKGCANGGGHCTISAPSDPCVGHQVGYVGDAGLLVHDVPVHHSGNGKGLSVHLFRDHHGDVISTHAGVEGGGRQYTGGRGGLGRAGGRWAVKQDGVGAVGA